MCNNGGRSYIPDIPSYIDTIKDIITPKTEPLALRKLCIVYNTACNIDCALCFADHDKIGDGKTLSNSKLFPFMKRFLKTVSNNWIVWEGKGEVLAAPYFYDAINWCTRKFPYTQHTVITNGTLSTALTRFDSPGKINLSVSLDGLKEFHDKNRGIGNFDKTVEFLRFASKMNFKSICVRTIVTQENLYALPEFRQFIIDINRDIKIYLQELLKPQKPCKYDKLYVSSDILKLLANEKYGIITEPSFGPEGSKRFCIHPDGIYNCGNNIVKIGDFNESPDKILLNFTESKLGCDRCPNNTCSNTEVTYGTTD